MEEEEEEEEEEGGGIAPPARVPVLRGTVKLSIGSEDDDRYLFANVLGIEVDRTGGILVADPRLNSVRLFDATGRLVEVRRWPSNVTLDDGYLGPAIAVGVRTDSLGGRQTGNADACITESRVGTASPYVKVHSWLEPVSVIYYRPGVVIRGPKAVPHN